MSGMDPPLYKILDHERDLVAYGIVGIVVGLLKIGALDKAEICRANRDRLRDALTRYTTLTTEIENELDKVS